MWLDNLKELKTAKGMSTKQIADLTNLPEKTVSRIFSGDTENPYVDTLHRIVTVLDGSLDDIFAEGTYVVGRKNLKQANDELAILQAEKDMLVAENAVLKEMNSTLTTEMEILKVQLKHKDELLALHNYYNKLKTTNNENPRSPYNIRISGAKFLIHLRTASSFAACILNCSRAFFASLFAITKFSLFGSGSRVLPALRPVFSK